MKTKTYLAFAIIAISINIVWSAPDDPSSSERRIVRASSDSTSPLTSHIGRECNVQIRNDIYATSSESNQHFSGTLRMASKDWIVIETPKELWIPMNVIYTIEFSKPQ